MRRSLSGWVVQVAAFAGIVTLAARLAGLRLDRAALVGAGAALLSGLSLAVLVPLFGMLGRLESRRADRRASRDARLSDDEYFAPRRYLGGD